MWTWWCMKTCLTLLPVPCELQRRRTIGHREPRSRPSAWSCGPSGSPLEGSVSAGTGSPRPSTTPSPSSPVSSLSSFVDTPTASSSSSPSSRYYHLTNPRVRQFTMLCALCVLCVCRCVDEHILSARHRSRTRPRSITQGGRPFSAFPRP